MWSRSSLSMLCMFFSCSWVVCHLQHTVNCPGGVVEQYQKSLQTAVDSHSCWSSQESIPLLVGWGWSLSHLARFQWAGQSSRASVYMVSLWLLLYILSYWDSVQPVLDDSQGWLLHNLYAIWMWSGEDAGTESTFPIQIHSSYRKDLMWNATQNPGLLNQKYMFYALYFPCSGPCLISNTIFQSLCPVLNLNFSRPIR